VILWLVPTREEASHLVPEMHWTARSGLWWGEDGSGTWVICGIGPAAAAMTATIAISALEPERVVLLGIAGAYRQSGVAVGDLLQASSERFADLGYRAGDHYLDLDAMGFPMHERPDNDLGCRFSVAPLHQGLETVPFLTVSQLTNSHETADALFTSCGAAIENMEGAGVALAAHQLRTPFHELRAVSNMVGPRDPRTWQVAEPLGHLGALIRSIN